MEKIEAIFGNDTRKEASMTNIPYMNLLIKDVCAFFSTADVVNGYDNVSTLSTKLLQEIPGAASIDPIVRFQEQPAAAIGTGYLIQDGIIVAAQEFQDFSKVVVVFNYLYSDSQADAPVPQSSDIYQISSCIFQFKNIQTNIFIYLLDRIRPLSFQRQKHNKQALAVAPEEAIFALGYASGTPLKYVAGKVGESQLTDGNTRVIPYTFLSNITIFPSMQGSPVFVYETGQFLGVLACDNAQSYVLDQSNGVMEAYYIKDFYYEQTAPVDLFEDFYNPPTTLLGIAIPSSASEPVTFNVTVSTIASTSTKLYTAVVSPGSSSNILMAGISTINIASLTFEASDETPCTLFFNNWGAIDSGTSNFTLPIQNISLSYKYYLKN